MKTKNPSPDTINVTFEDDEVDGKLPMYIHTPCLRQPTHVCINSEVYDLRPIQAERGWRNEA